MYQNSEVDQKKKKKKKKNYSEAPHPLPVINDHSLKSSALTGWVVPRGGGGGAHLPIGNARPLCTVGAFLILSLTTKVPTQGGLAHLPIGNARPLCTARAFPILFLPTEVTTDNCPFTFPLPTLPPPPWQSSPLPPALCPLPANWNSWGSLLRGGGHDHCKPSTHYKYIQIG